MFQSNKSNSRSLWKVINNVVPSKSQEKHVYSKDLKTVANDFNSYISLLSDAVLLTQLRSWQEIIISPI